MCRQTYRQISVQVCMYVCMYVGMYACMYVCMYVTCMFVYMYVRTDGCAQACVYIYICLHTCMHAYMSVCWQAKRTWVTYKDFSRAYNIVLATNPMSTLTLVLLSITTLTLAHISGAFRSSELQIDSLLLSRLRQHRAATSKEPLV